MPVALYTVPEVNPCRSLTRCADFCVDGLNSKYAERISEGNTVNASAMTTQTKKGPLEVRISPGVASRAIPPRCIPLTFQMTSSV
jgi:hypothetical protein